MCTLLIISVHHMQLYTPANTRSIISHVVVEAMVSGAIAFPCFYFFSCIIRGKSGALARVCRMV